MGYVDARRGNLDGIPFYLYGMKEPDYTMIIMATYGTLQRMGPEKTRTFKLNNEKTTTTFKYPEVVSNHYRYRDMIDNQNGMRMHPIALEETWLTSRWPNRDFSFLLAVTVVNVQNAATYFFNKGKIDALTAKRLIARDLIFNKHMKNVEEPMFWKWRRRGPIDHFLIMLPKKIIINGRLVVCKDPYQRQTCGVCCTKHCRSYCSCTPGLILCTDCYANHRAEIAMVNS